MSRLRCLIVDDEPIARSIISSYITRVPFLEEMAQCRSGMEALSWLADHDADIIFLDIQMPDITGLALAKVVSDAVQVVFTTAYREHAVEGFELRAADYLLKPISFDRFLQSMDRVRESRPVDDHIFVRADRRMIRIPFAELFYIESLGDYIQIHLQGRRVTVRDTISHMVDLLPSESFMRVHRSYIVGLHHMNSYSTDQIDIGGTMIPISRSYRQSFLVRMGLHS